MVGEKQFDSVFMRLPEQIRTIPKSKLIGSCIYNITDDEQEKVENALKTQLGIS